MVVEWRRARRPYGWAAAAVIASLIAPEVRGELVVVPIALALALLFIAWSSSWARRRRADWTVGDWLGVITLVLGAIFVISGYGSHHSQEWYGVTTYWKHRIIVSATGPPGRSRSDSV